MIFSWLKRDQKRAEVAPVATTILSMPADRFAEFVLETLKNDIPATRTMCVVAYANLGPIIAASASVASERGERLLTVDDFIQMTLSRLNTTNDEIARRRLLWFFLAALVHRLDGLTERNQSLLDRAADVWLLLSDSGRYLANLLQHNVVWDESEKAYFSDIKTSAEGIWYVMTIMLPARYRIEPKLKTFAKSHNIFLY
jgi:hypothetical protein